MALSRRGFLSVSAATLAALAAGAAVVMRGDPEKYRALAGVDAGVTLSLKELAVLHALVDRFVPDRAPFPTAREVGVARRIDKELAFHGDKMLSDVKSALFVLEHDGVAHASVSRFTALSAEEQDARLIAMSTGSDVERQVVSGLRILVLFFYYADESTWPHIHYDGPPMPRTAPPADSRVARASLTVVPS